MSSASHSPASPASSSAAGAKTKPSYKHVPHSQKPPHLVAKRNARERRRVQAVNQAFYRLRKSVPIENRNKRVSKVKTLQRAIDYIRRLERILAEDDEVAAASLAAATGLALPEASGGRQPSASQTRDRKRATSNKQQQQQQRQPPTNCDLDPLVASAAAAAAANDRNQQKPQVVGAATKQRRGRKPAPGARQQQAGEPTPVADDGCLLPALGYADHEQQPQHRHSYYEHQQPSGDILRDSQSAYNQPSYYAASPNYHNNQYVAYASDYGARHSTGEHWAGPQGVSAHQQQQHQFAYYYSSSPPYASYEVGAPTFAQLRSPLAASNATNLDAGLKLVSADSGADQSPASSGASLALRRQKPAATSSALPPTSPATVVCRAPQQQQVSGYQNCAPNNGSHLSTAAGKSAFASSGVRRAPANGVGGEHQVGGCASPRVVGATAAAAGHSANNLQLRLPPTQLEQYHQQSFQGNGANHSSAAGSIGVSMANSAGQRQQQQHADERTIATSMSLVHNQQSSQSHLGHNHQLQLQHQQIFAPASAPIIQDFTV